MDPVTIKLAVPIMVAGEETRAITIRRKANFGDMREGARTGTEMDALHLLISRLCGITRDEVDSLDVDDANAVINAIGPFVGSGAKKAAGVKREPTSRRSSTSRRPK